jgi:hypothetical protein
VRILLGLFKTPEAMDWPLLITEFGANDSLIVKIIIKMMANSSISGI